LGVLVVDADSQASKFALLAVVESWRSHCGLGADWP